MAVASLGNLTYMEIENSGIIRGDFGAISASTYLLLSNTVVSIITSLVTVGIIVTTHDPQLFSKYKSHPFLKVLICICILLNYNTIWLFQSYLFSLNYFNVKYGTPTMPKLLIGITVVCLFQQLINLAYSAMQMLYSPQTTGRLLAVATFSINSPYVIEMIILAALGSVLATYLLCKLRRGDYD